MFGPDFVLLTTLTAADAALAPTASTLNTSAPARASRMIDRNVSGRTLLDCDIGFPSLLADQDVLDDGPGGGPTLPPRSIRVHFSRGPAGGPSWARDRDTPRPCPTPLLLQVTRWTTATNFTTSSARARSVACIGASTGGSNVWWRSR